MDIFGMYGSRSDDDEVTPAPEPEPEPVAEQQPEPPPVEPEEETAPIERVKSAKEDAVAHFVESMDGLEFDGQIVRPYARTGGRTRSAAGLELETILSLTVREVPADLPPDHYAVAELCLRPISVAEVAAYRSLPIGAARVIISDLLEYRLVTLSGPEKAGAPTVDLMRRVLEGLHRL
jgi:hypothetical protein